MRPLTANPPLKPARNINQNKMHQIKYALFYDFHTSPNHPGVGSKFDAEALTERFLQCGVDYVTFHARCNMGMAYYNTKLGIKHPSLEKDLFGELAFACQRKNIALGAYFNGGLSRMEALLHPDWARISPEGKIYQEPLDSPFSMTMCYNSPYREHLKAMTLELAELYPLKGFFFDCMGPFPCVCPHCVPLMQKEGLEPGKLQDVISFAAASASKLADELACGLRKVNPDYLFYFNDIEFENQKKAGNYLEFECLPSKSGGYLYMQAVPRYMRTLGKPCVHMTGRFHSWSDFGGLRNLESLKYELLFAMVNGLRPNIGDHLLPEGSINEAVFSRIEEVYSYLRQYDRFLEGSQPQTEVALINPNGKPRLGNTAEMLGAMRMLSELSLQFDIVSKEASWDKYKLLLLPDNIEFDQEIAQRVAKHLTEGKCIIASGTSGLDEKRIFPEAWPVRFMSAAKFDPAYFQSQIPGLIEDMPFSFYEKAYEVKAKPGAEVYAQLLRPAINFGWNGIIPEYYNPPYEKTSLPFLAISRQVAYFSGRVFAGYHKKAPAQLRRIVEYAFKRMLPKPALKILQAPSYLQGLVSSRANQTQVHLFACIPEKRGSESESIEAELPVSGLQVALHTGGRRPETVFLALGKEPLHSWLEDEYLYIKVPDFSGFAMIVVDFPDLPCQGSIAT